MSATIAYDGIGHNKSNGLNDSNGISDWNQVDFKTANTIVLSLQRRIAKATIKRNFKKVKNLQKLLVRSKSARIMAIRQVTCNRGKRTPGVDGETWLTSGDKFKAIDRLSIKGYKPKPLRRIYIPKPGKKEKRPLSIPTMLDRAMQSLFNLALDPMVESLADKNSYGFRKHRSCQDAIDRTYRIFKETKTGLGARWCLEGDIKSCFDRISHDWLIRHIPFHKEIFFKWFKVGYIFKDELYPTDDGTPQGGIISPTLANLTLDGLEYELEKRFTGLKDGTKIGDRNTVKARSYGINFVRYADDFVVSAKSRKVLQEEVIPVIEDFLEPRGLELSKTKTSITDKRKGFDFLGFNIKMYRNRAIKVKRYKLHVRPEDDKVKGLQTRINQVIAQYRGAGPYVLITKLNPIIRGWANYYKGVYSSQDFSELDHWLYKRMYSTLKRTTKLKDGKLKARYMRTIQGQKYRIVATKQAGNKSYQAKLLRFHDFKAGNGAYPALPSTHNAYLNDGEYIKVLSKRQNKGWTNLNKLVRSLLYSQYYTCPVCGGKLKVGELEEPFDIHHKVPRNQGGSDEWNNLQLVHVSCHHRLHGNRDNL